jgi:PAS domain S-box-containing protein
MLIVDGASHVLDVNARFLELTGLERAEVISQHTWSLLSSSSVPEQPARVGGRLLMVGYVRCKDGSRWIQGSSGRSSVTSASTPATPSWTQGA